MEKIILYFITFFAILGGIDKVIGNKLGLGKKFEEGFMSMGSLALSIIGIYAVAPVLAQVLLPVIKPIYQSIGADPSIFVASILAVDMGGYHSAMEIAQTKEIGLFSGLLLGSMLGATISYTIPVAIGLIEKEDYPFFIKGILAGIITIPIGSIVGGLLSGIEFSIIFVNLIPVILGKLTSGISAVTLAYLMTKSEVTESSLV